MGNASIFAYVNIDLYFHILDGPVKIIVEAYVVKGMNTPSILRNDFGDQYSISVIHQEGSCLIEFGDSNWRMPVNNSVSPPFLDKDGHAFKLRVLNSSAKSTHQRNQRFKCKIKFVENYKNIWSGIKIIIPHETSIAVPILANFPSSSKCLYVEKVFSTNQNADDVYAPLNSLLLKKNPCLHVANFSASTITFQVGQVLRKGHNLNSWLDRTGKYSPENQQKIHVHTQEIWTLAKTWTPDLGLGSTKKVATVTSKVKGFLPTQKIDLETENIHSEGPDRKSVV